MQWTTTHTNTHTDITHTTHNSTQHNTHEHDTCRDTHTHTQRTEHTRKRVAYVEVKHEEIGDELRHRRRLLFHHHLLLTASVINRNVCGWLYVCVYVCLHLSVDDGLEAGVEAVRRGAGREKSTRLTGHHVTEELRSAKLKMR